jgi:hypothetical protein
MRSRGGEIWGMSKPTELTRRVCLGTLSHRLANGENMPMLAGTTPQTATANYYTFLPALSTLDPASTITVVSYLRLLTMPDSYPNPSAFKSISRAKTQFMYASSTSPPGSNQENAILTQHDQVSPKYPHSVESGLMGCPFSPTRRS